MTKIIVTSRYLKKGSAKKLRNYVKYIATREGVVPTMISERENYIGYLANRPGAVKFSSHGLFNGEDKPISLEKTAKEIAEHKGNVWTHVVSLRREDAQAMGYDNLNAWRELVKRHIPDIAINQKIDLRNLKWYAAFHDKETNPHVHIVVYSTNEREGFLSEKGIEKIRSCFANDIYHDELHHLYSEQTDIRNLLKKESAGLMKRLADEISENVSDNEYLCQLVLKLSNQLKESTGRKVYGYLKSDAKKTVDEIFIQLSENEAIQKMYSMWCDMEQKKHDTYSSAKLYFPALTDNKEFKSVKNMIIQTVLDMDTVTVTEHTDSFSSDGNSSDKAIADTVLSLFVNLSRCIEEDYNETRKKCKCSCGQQAEKDDTEEKDGGGDEGGDEEWVLRVCASSEYERYKNEDQISGSHKCIVYSQWIILQKFFRRALVIMYLFL